jgi:DNA replication and repair protein RecF
LFLRSLTLRQFRNHDNLTLETPAGVSLFIGPNGAGKTNLLEAIAILATGASPRGADCESMVEWNKDGFAVLGAFEGTSGSEQFTLEMKYKNGLSRVIRENGHTPVRLKDLVGRVPLVSFLPEDLTLLKGEPELRRRALNLVLLQVDAGYAEALRIYQDALKSRNAALRQIAEGMINTDTLDAWDSAIIKAGLVICAKRNQFVNDFSPLFSRVEDRVSGAADEMTIEYRPSIAGPWNEEGAERWRQKLRNSRPQEIAVGMTLTGPQRDDVAFLMTGRPARSCASEGQMRTAAIAFKLAEIPYIEERRNQKPICLLDDVFSELDADRARHLLNELSRTGQCFVTLTGLESWPKENNLPVSIFTIDGNGVRLGKYENETLSEQIVSKTF